MKQRRIALALILLLCLSALLSGALLILHSNHLCHQNTCSVCMMLVRSSETFMYFAFALAGIGMIVDSGMRNANASRENRFSSDGTLVRLKVKLQN